MNWKLILQLSLFGLFMAIATVFWIPSKIEPLFWLAIFIFNAYLIAKKTSGKYFLHGFMVSLVNSVWITSAHFLLFDTYISNHPEVIKMNANMPMANHPLELMLLTGPIIGAISGLFLGLFAVIAGKLVKK